MKMCGILFSNKPKLDIKKFKLALESLKHRGPDYCGLFTKDSAFLGHTRLAIIDLNSRSNQPMTSKDDRYLIVFNGEIFNYKYLARKFNLEFIHSDTELVLELYIKIGPKSVSLLEGMFAFIIYDKDKNDFFVARDAIGIKPLFYIKHSNGWTFASEVRALRFIEDCNDLNIEGLETYRNLRIFLNNETTFKNIYSFPPGYYYFDNQFIQYWQLNQDTKAPPSDEELFELVESSIKKSTIADVPFGAYLSGGVDSSIISAISGTTLTGVVGMANSNEFQEARHTSYLLGTEHLEVSVTPEQFLQRAVEIIKFRQTPVAVPNEVLLNLLNERLKKSVSVLLSGEGSDELFAGYDKIFSWANSIKALRPESFARMYNYTDYPNLDVFDQIISLFSLDTPYKTISKFFQIAHLEGLLQRADAASMAHGLEVRVPFVNQNLANRLFGVEFNWKCAGGQPKNPLRELTQKYLPREVAFRNKIGFPVRVNELFAKTNFQVFANPYDTWFNFNMNMLECDYDFRIHGRSF